MPLKQQYRDRDGSLTARQIGDIAIEVLTMLGYEIVPDDDTDDEGEDDESNHHE